MDMDFDTAVKLNLYQTLAGTGKAPSSVEVARSLGAAVEEVEAAFQRLHKKRLLVPEPGDPSRIRMAPPFSGVKTAFLVKARQRVYYANCVWDALGIAAALKEDAIAEAADGHTGEPMTLEVRNGEPVPQECAIHFAVPAARWWNDIIYT
ncbi:MAG TPA: organomercurial lyase [Thermoanaerobaculia bacterium]|nr:organomercurial lyase [Thermoanaerobaculia bacterium]